MPREPSSDLRDLLDHVLGKGVTIRPLRPGEAVDLPLSQSPDQPSSIRIEVECPDPDRTPLTASRSWIVIVSRDRPAVFETLKGLVEPEHGQVMWDRRVTRRRIGQASISTERREADRRGAAPTTWSIWGLLMVPQEAPDR